MTIEHSEDMSHILRQLKPSKENRLAPNQFEESLRITVPAFATHRYGELQTINFTSVVNITTLAFFIINLPAHTVRILLSLMAVMNVGNPPAGTFAWLSYTPRAGINRVPLTAPGEIQLERPIVLQRPIILPQTSSSLDFRSQAAVGALNTVTFRGTFIDVPEGESVAY